MLYQRDDVLDVELYASKHTILNKNNGLDLTLTTGWNELADCEISVKPATGGLRLLTNEATIVEDSGLSFSKPPSAGVFFFGAIQPHQSLTVRFPFSLEQDFNLVSLKIEVTYKTASEDTYYLAKFLSVPVALAVGVNVQDIFKHDALFSRFSVSTASASPLLIFATELLESELFASDSSGAPLTANTVTVFPKQPASFLYKVKRRPGVGRASKRGARVMHLKLHYSQLHAEIEQLVGRCVAEVLAKEEQPVASLARTVRAVVVDHVRNYLDAIDLERAALLGAVSTGFMSKIPWAVNLRDLARLSSGEDAGAAIATVMATWQSANPRLPIPPTAESARSSILIPVEIPSIPVVHTADIRLDSDALKDSTTPVASVNQVLQATLHLRWTRLWDTTPPRKLEDEDYQEFSYDVSASSSETWLLGGRRKGHFVIPHATYDPAETSTNETSWLPISSTPETEASIPLVLIPQCEGWLAYPSVDIREVHPDGGVAEQQEDKHQGLEVDWKNSGETIRVVGGRSGVTVSLDASGPGGGPLLLSVDRLVTEGARLIT